MIRQVHKRLTYANVMSTGAVFLALGGSAYAGLQLGRGDVERSNIANGAVNSAKVKNNSLKLRDFRAAERAQLAGPIGPTGPIGPAGAKGDKGDKGDAGNAGTPAVLNRTDLRYGGEDLEASPTANFELIRAVGDFTKQQAGSVIKLTWHAHSRA